MAEARLRLGDRHALAVVRAADGTVRAEPQHRTDAGWVRAAAGDGAGAALIERLRGGTDEPGPFRVTRGAVGRSASDERPVAVDQTNESWVVGGAAVVKWSTEPLAGPHPAPERLRRLAAAGFTATPRLWGLVEWRPDDDDEWTLVASVVDYVPGAVDGWTWCVDEARRGLGVESGPVRPFAAELGRLTASMHLALADDEPPRADEASARAAYARAVAEVDALPELAAHRERIVAALAPLGRMAGAALVPVHGDLHVGQVLRAPDGPLRVIDFDGNPTRGPAERSAPYPPALDVAGLLVSLENVGHVVRRHAAEVTEEAAAAWSRQRQDELLAAYRHELVGTDLLDESLLDAYRWQQLVREFRYAAEHLPRWMYVPTAGLRRWTTDEP